MDEWMDSKMGGYSLLAIVALSKLRIQADDDEIFDHNLSVSFHFRCSVFQESVLCASGVTAER